MYSFFFSSGLNGSSRISRNQWDPSEFSYVNISHQNVSHNQKHDNSVLARAQCILQRSCFSLEGNTNSSNIVMMKALASLLRRKKKKKSNPTV